MAQTSAKNDGFSAEPLGANFLDSNYRSWASKIIRPVRIGIPGQCILSQLYEDGYGIGMAMLGLSEEMSAKFGFRGPLDSEMSVECATALEAEWEEAIAHRLKR